MGHHECSRCDYTVESPAENKIKKAGEELNLHLKKTKDILAKLGEVKTAKQLLVGFALETTNEAAYAQGKLKTKNADLIVLNSMQDKGAGFGKIPTRLPSFLRTVSNMILIRSLKQQLLQIL